MPARRGSSPCHRIHSCPSHYPHPALPDTVTVSAPTSVQVRAPSVSQLDYVTQATTSHVSPSRPDGVLTPLTNDETPSSPRIQSEIRQSHPGMVSPALVRLTPAMPVSQLQLRVRSRRMAHPRYQALKILQPRWNHLPTQVHQNNATLLNNWDKTHASLAYNLTTPTRAPALTRKDTRRFISTLQNETTEMGAVLIPSVTHIPDVDTRPELKPSQPLIPCCFH